MKTEFTQHEQIKHLERRRNAANIGYSIAYLIGLAIFIAVAVRSYQAYQVEEILVQLIGGFSMIGALLCMLIVANHQVRTSIAHYAKLSSLENNESEAQQ